MMDDPREQDPSSELDQNITSEEFASIGDQVESGKLDPRGIAEGNVDRDAFIQGNVDRDI
jgi:hypothetical protein